MLDESNVPVANAVVTSGAATTTTNTNGMFILQNISLSKENGSVTVVKAGYFKGIRSFKTTAGKNHSVRLQLMQRVLSGTVNAAAGGTITSNGGATINFPANAFVTSAGAAYTGVVSVYSRWINPTAANLPFVIPGDLRGVSTGGVENILETYGMVGAELADAAGNVLKIATGKTATVSFPIPASISATAPASIVLWHFDDATARWNENGTATKTGSTYTAQVDKFSFWNCDVGTTNFINLDYTLINATTNSPLVSTSTRIKRANGTYGYGITNNAGFVSGLVPKNETLVLEVIASNGCGNFLYSQNIGPLTANTSLGNVSVVISTQQSITFTGILLNCNTTAVTNGYVSLYTNSGNSGFGTTNSAGEFSFSILNCSSANIIYNYQGTDNLTSKQSAVITGNATSGIINLSVLNTCAIISNINVYSAGKTIAGATIWMNNLPIIIATRPDSSVANSIFVDNNDVYVAGTEGKIAKLWKNGVPINLTDGTNGAIANSVFVYGNDVYVAGHEVVTANNNLIAKVWKNGIASNLTNGQSRAFASSVFVYGNDVYVAGHEVVTANNNLIAKVWKNGVAINLTGIAGTAIANSLYIANNNIFVAGQDYNNIYGVPNYSGGRACIWKNLTTSFTTYTDPYIINARANSVFISGNDEYACGYQKILENGTEKTIAKLWKNGIVTNLTNGVNIAFANSIYVLNGNIYIVFNEYIGNVSTAKLWKNGNITNLTDGITSASINSIFVK